MLLHKVKLPQALAVVDTQMKLVLYLDFDIATFIVLPYKEHHCLYFHIIHLLKTINILVNTTNRISNITLNNKQKSNYNLNITLLYHITQNNVTRRCGQYVISLNK